MSITTVFIIFTVSALLSYGFTITIKNIFIRANILSKNYKGDFIPQGVGIVFPLYSLFGYAINIIVGKNHTQVMLLLHFVIISTGFIGFIDDILGTRNVHGLKGHFNSLITGQLTTGVLKAILVFLISLIFSLSFSADFFNIMLNTFILTLSANFFNLLDLGPGRAIKAYLFAFCIILFVLIATHKLALVLPFIPLVGSVIGYMPHDLNEKCMMGDAGSNVLGISAGISFVIALNLYTKLFVFAFLVWAHVFTEKYSLTDVIKNNRYLSYLDNLGKS